MEAALDQPSSRLRPLVDAAIAGDRDAFRALVEPLVARALGLAAILTRSQTDAEDVGYGRYEEIDSVVSGGNYGWRV